MRRRPVPRGSALDVGYRVDNLFDCLGQSARETVACETHRPGVANMTGCMDKTGLNLNISAVERETGLSKDVLRVWERRYAFPKPSRDDNGERVYTAAEITKLRAIKRLMDVGLRPGKIILCSQQELNALAEARITPRGDRARAGASSATIVSMLQDARRARAAAGARQSADAAGPAALRAGYADAAQSRDRRRLDARRTARSSRSISTPSNCRLRCARRSMRFRAQTGTPRVLLTTFPASSTALGLLMVEALLVPEAAQCISLGVQTPLDDIRRAALAHKAHIVALSFSGRVSRCARRARASRRCAGSCPPHGHAVGGRRNDAPRAQDDAGRRADPGPRRRSSARSQAGARTGRPRRSGVSAAA